MIRQFVWACALSWVLSTSARAQGTQFIHIARSGETLASIAQTYYGNPARENILVAENGLADQGGAAIVEGLRLVIPTVTYHRVREGDTWRGMAEHYYGDPERAAILFRANDAEPGSVPDVGAQLLIPYPVRHVVKQGELLIHIADQYYADRGEVRLLRVFNRGKLKLTRGQIVLVPVMDLTLSEEGRQRLEASTGQKIAVGEVKAAQAVIEERIPELRKLLREGRFVETVALANQLLGSGNLTGYQELRILREAATAYVALGRQDLAAEAFQVVLEKQPDLELDSVLTSPRILEALEAAHELVEAAKSKPARAQPATQAPPDK